ncbi:hypothetical protein [Streptomyces sp. NPDC096013]|uniref:hypothetical protein n=1 Tax=Streptomyces sp. NPDC096013 TaxID=3366069 RepID=UPI00380A93E7
MDHRALFTISGAVLSGLAADWAVGSSTALARAEGGKPIGEDFVAFLENSTQHLATLPTEQRQHTAMLLDAHLATVTELLKHGRCRTAVRVRLLPTSPAESRRYF